MEKKKVLILATGGTIASVSTDNGFVPGISGDELVEQIPMLKEIAEIKARQLMNIDSSDMRPSDWRTIARAVAHEADLYDGIVITHGTDTMCYTSSALSFMLSDLNIPVVLTGSQKPFVVADSDAPRNVIDAVKVATSDLVGVSIVFNGKIINGSRAFKMYSKNNDAYVSRNYPLLGTVDDDGVHITHRATRLQTGQPLMTGICEDVILLKMTPGSSPSMLDYVGTAGYRGVIIEGFGTGGISNLNRGMMDGIRYLVDERNVPVVVISQCPYDGVNLAVYGVGDRALQAGVIPGNDMTTEAAVVKLMWILGQTNDMDKIRDMVLTNYCDEISAVF